MVGSFAGCCARGWRASERSAAEKSDELSPSHSTPYGQKIRTARKLGSYLSRRGLGTSCPLRFWGDQWCPLRTGGQMGEAHGVGTYPGLHQRDGGPGAAAAE